jgi:hypothetical protein
MSSLIFSAIAFKFVFIIYPLVFIYLANSPIVMFG